MKDSIWLNFNNTPPEINYLKGLNSGELYSRYSSVSDYNGNLLIYATDKGIYNKNHTALMYFKPDENHGNNLILPKPYNDSIYYVFRINMYKSLASYNGLINKLHYYTVNMNLNSGLGAIISKDTIFTDTTVIPMLCATVADSNKGIWVTTIDLKKRLVSVFLGEKGVGKPKIGATIQSLDLQNYPFQNFSFYDFFLAAFSHRGNYISITQLDNGSHNDINLLKFNKKVGSIDSVITITDSIRFSSVLITPNERDLLAFSIEQHIYKAKIYKYSLLNFDSNQILNSKKQVYDCSKHFSHQVQISAGQYNYKNQFYFENSYLDGGYGKTFFGMIDKGSLDSVENMNMNFEYFSSRSSISPFGFPNFLSSYFDSNHFQPCENFEVYNTCKDEYTQFYAPPCDTIARYFWNFGDTTVQDSLNHSTLSNPVHFYKNEGSYIVSLTVKTVLYTRRFIDTIQISKRFFETPDIGTDTEICEGEEAHFTITNSDNKSILWSDSTTNNEATFTQDGYVWGKIYNSCNGAYDSLYLKVYPKPKAVLPNDTVICLEPTAILNPGDYKYSDYTWSEGGTKKELEINSNGTYTVDISNKCFSSTYQTNVYFENEQFGFTGVNIFTPNNDGINDLFNIYNSSTDYFNLEVFNRWGTRVFYTDNPVEYWTGKDFPSGIYFYALRFKNCTGDLIEKKGTVTLSR